MLFGMHVVCVQVRKGELQELVFVSPPYLALGEI